MRPWLTLVVLLSILTTTRAADIYVRFRVVEPTPKKEDKFKVTTGGHIHSPNWYLTGESREVTRGAWSDWIDLTKWPLHGRQNRSGGVAEWPSMTLAVERVGGEKPVGVKLDVQLADKPDEGSVVISFSESSGSNTVGFLLPHPLREKKDEFETGTQMTQRHAAWAKEATGGRSRKLEKFDVITSLWGHYDVALAKQEAATLRLLGFNVLGSAPPEAIRENGFRTYTASWHYQPDPDAGPELWAKGEGKQIASALETPEGKWTYENMAHYVVADEISVMDFRAIAKDNPAKLNGWFRAYLREKGETDKSLGKPIDGVEYPAAAMYEKTLPRDADLPTRKIHYHAGKFGQRWSVQQLKQTGDLIKQSFPGAGMKTETLPTDHGFFNAWGAPHMGMSYRLLDLFEIGQRRAVDIVSAEDWLGLNHMYGPNYTWTGAQSFEYLSAMIRSGFPPAGSDSPVQLRGLITPSDDGYLRLKAYSNLAQGSKSFFFWTYGPTFIGTENYWSDLRSEYDGIAKFTAALEKAEDALYDAQPVRDPVAILYSVSHDMWHTDDPAVFVETRLTWHALRHLSVQPDFLREEDAEAGRLKDYKVLYVHANCLTRKASAAIDEWVKRGGVVYLSAGAATRDEFYEPYTPPFAAAVWPDDAASKVVKQTGHSYNERGDLPGIEPLTTAKLNARDQSVTVKAIGYRLDVRPPRDRRGRFIAGAFDDGKPAATESRHGRGTVIGVGLLPGLAYSPFKRGQTTLDEVWPAEPRAVIGAALQHAGIKPVAQSSMPVVQASLLDGPRGAAVVLANFTYRPVDDLRVEISLPYKPARAESTEGVKVDLKHEGDRTVLTLPLEWTDIVLLPKP